MMPAMLLSAVRRRLAPSTPPHPFATGSYLTDGRRLFRVVSHFTPGAAQLQSSIEDCLTLEVSAHAPSELYSMRLRPVRTPRTA
jgi:hypothetical protein